MDILYKTSFLEFKSAKAPSGNNWYYVKRTNDKKGFDSAVVIATIVKTENEYSFLLLKTIRPPMKAENKSKYCLECPAGLIGDEKEETLEDCIKKELLEETGLMADKIYIELKNSSTSAGLSSETLTFITAIVENYKIIKPPVSDGGIITDRILIKTNEIYDYLNSTDTSIISIASPTVCSIYYALNRLKKL